MKKGTFVFYTLFLFLCFFISACKVEVQDQKLLQKPDIDISDKQVTLIIHKISSTTGYINIYRQDVTDANNPSEIVNVGIIYPNALPSDDKTYRYIDKLVHQKSNYIYRVRYADSDGYHYTNWSNTITIDEEFQGAYPQITNLTYQCPSSLSFTYDETDFKLLLSGTVSPPDIEDFDTYHPMIIVNNGIKTEVFKISPNSLSDQEPIALKDHLSSDFMDVPIIIEGILAQKDEYINPEAEPIDRILKTVYWTESKWIKIKGYTDNRITIPSVKNNSGLDYTRKVQ